MAIQIPVYQLTLVVTIDADKFDLRDREHVEAYVHDRLPIRALDEIEEKLGDDSGKPFNVFWVDTNFGSGGE